MQPTLRMYRNIVLRLARAFGICHRRTSLTATQAMVKAKSDQVFLIDLLQNKKGNALTFLQIECRLLCQNSIGNHLQHQCYLR